MRIVYCGGNCGEGSAPWATENAYIDAFAKLGHEVVPVKQQDALTGDYPASEWRDADLTIYTRTHNATALQPSFTDIWRLLEQTGTRTASIHLDVFRGIPEREEWVEHGDPLFTTQDVFTADGSAPEWWQERGVNHHWLPPAFDDRHLDVSHRDFVDSQPKGVEVDGQIVFVGSEGYHACYPFRPALVQHLRNKYGPRFVFIGDGGQYGKMRMGPLAALYASDAIFVGDHCFATENRPDYWSDRLPETLGRGGFMLYPATPGTEVFKHGFVPVIPGDLEDLDGQIASWSAMTPESRRRIAERGRTMVLGAHTYVHRAREVLDTIGLA